MLDTSRTFKDSAFFKKYSLHDVRDNNSNICFLDSQNFDIRTPVQRFRHTLHYVHLSYVLLLGSAQYYRQLIFHIFTLYFCKKYAIHNKGWRVKFRGVFLRKVWFVCTSNNCFGRIFDWKWCLRPRFSLFLSSFFFIF